MSGSDHHSNSTLFSATVGNDGPVVVLLHGLAASGRYWQPVIERIDPNLLRLHLVDLLGFGHSPKPRIRYTAMDHLDALDRWRTSAGLAGTPIRLVGHSLGALLAVLWASRAAGIESVLAISYPCYEDARRGKRYLSHLSLLNRLTLSRPPLARALCWIMCHSRPFWRWAAPHLAPDLPPDVARDAVDHTWASFSGTLERTIFPSADGTPLRQLPTTAKVELLHGESDLTVPAAPVIRLAELLGVRATLVPHAGHDLPLSHPGLVADHTATISR